MKFLSGYVIGSGTRTAKTSGQVWRMQTFSEI